MAQTSTGWIDSFEDLLANVDSPKLFVKWGGIMAIAGALERKVWVKTKGSCLYPNLYTTLVAPPGVGKTEVIWRVRQLWERLEDHHVAHSSVTKASLIDDLNNATRRVTMPGKPPKTLDFNSLLIASDEFGVLLPAYDTEFMHTLTDIYDGKGYSESRRSRDVAIKITNPNVNLFAGCTPGYLKDTMPPGAWDQGFMSRMILIYDIAVKRTSLFASDLVDEKHAKALAASLRRIAKFCGKFGFTVEAKEFLDRWYLSGMQPAPTHPKLIHYNSRRITHLLRLSMIASASEENFPEITLLHVQTALGWLVEAEANMPGLFTTLTSGGDSEVIEECVHYLFQQYIKRNSKPVPETSILLFLQSRVGAQQVLPLINHMVKAKLIKRHITKIGTCYEPLKVTPS